MVHKCLHLLALLFSLVFINSSPISTFRKSWDANLLPGISDNHLEYSFSRWHSSSKPSEGGDQLIIFCSQNEAFPFHLQRRNLEKMLSTSVNLHFVSADDNLICFQSIISISNIDQQVYEKFSVFRVPTIAKIHKNVMKYLAGGKGKNVLILEVAVAPRKILLESSPPFVNELIQTILTKFSQYSINHLSRTSNSDGISMDFSHGDWSVLRNNIISSHKSNRDRGSSSSSSSSDSACELNSSDLVSTDKYSVRTTVEWLEHAAAVCVVQLGR